MKTLTYAYYPGCSLHSTAKEYDLSTKAICQKLNIELQEIPDWNCCGASTAHSTSHELAQQLPLRNLDIAKKMGMNDVVAPCAACYNRLKLASVQAGHSVQVLSMMKLIASLPNERIQQAVSHQLSGLKVACYYGCMMLRPKSVADGEDSENPTSLDRLSKLAGADPVAWSHATECCGGSLALSKQNIVQRLSTDIATAARESGADIIITACPMCQTNLDSRQIGDQRTPILYFTQLLGLAMGFSPNELGLQRLLISPHPALAKVLEGSVA